MSVDFFYTVASFRLLLFVDYNKIRFSHDVAFAVLMKCKGLTDFH